MCVYVRAWLHSIESFGSPCCEFQCTSVREPSAAPLIHLAKEFLDSILVTVTDAHFTFPIERTYKNSQSHACKTVHYHYEQDIKRDLTGFVALLMV